jgi:hypothetical protein
MAGTARAGDPYADAAKRAADMDASTRAEQLKNPNSEASADAQAEADARAKEEERAQKKNSGTSNCGAGTHRAPNGDCLAGSLGNPGMGSPPPPAPAPPGGMPPGPARMP